MEVDLILRVEGGMRNSTSIERFGERKRVSFENVQYVGACFCKVKAEFPNAEDIYFYFFGLFSSLNQFLRILRV